MRPASVTVRAKTRRCRHPSFRGCEATRCPTVAARSRSRSAGLPMIVIASASLVNVRTPLGRQPLDRSRRIREARDLPAGRVVLGAVQAVVA
jgi:hypothetical protein